jgi:hypothetical protein
MMRMHAIGNGQVKGHDLYLLVALCQQCETSLVYSEVNIHALPAVDAGRNDEQCCEHSRRPFDHAIDEVVNVGCGTFCQR